jgi:branched-chain amino acid transport system substrate-binding protein
MVQKPLYIRRKMSSFSLSRRNRKTATAVATLAAAALVLSGCAATDNGGAAGGELTLKIGTALPQTGNLAYLGPPEEAGVGLAIDEINAADKGIQIAVEYGDSGDTDNKAYETTIPRLLNSGVNAIIGAASSSVSLNFIDQVVGAGVIQFSPANTSAELTTYDDKGLFFRTAPSDTLQGEVLGNLIAEDGNETLAMIVINDSYGTGLAGFVKEAFEAAGGEVVAEPLYNTGDTNFSSQVAEVLAQSPDAILVVAFDEILTILPALLSDFPSDKLYLTDGNLVQYGDTFEPGTMTGAQGTTPGLNPDTIAEFLTRMKDFWVKAGNSELEDVVYGAESYDAVILLALAALAAGSVEGVDVAAKLQEVSGGSGNGTKCFTFAECADLINAGEVADYDGVSGPVTFNEFGDPTEATIGIYVYKEDNTFIPRD